MTTETAVRTWNIDASHSIAEFAVRHMMVSTVKGRFGRLEGAIEGDEANPAASAVRATIDVAGLDDSDLDVELVERTVRLTGKGLDRRAPRLELRFDLPQDTDLDHVHVVEEDGRIVVRAPHRSPRHRKLEIEHAERVIHPDATPV